MTESIMATARLIPEMESDSAKIKVEIQHLLVRSVRIAAFGTVQARTAIAFVNVDSAVRSIKAVEAFAAK